MGEFDGRQRRQCKNVVDEFLFAQSDVVHNPIEVIAGRLVANGCVPQGIFDIAGQTKNLPRQSVSGAWSSRTKHTPEPPMPRR